MIRFSLYLILLLIVACSNDQASKKLEEQVPAPSATESGTEAKANATSAEDHTESTAPSGVGPSPSSGVGPGKTLPPQTNGFMELTKLDPSIKLDIKYATKDNFTKTQIYDCPKCLLRPEAAIAIEKAHKALKVKGLGLKMFDCYRPKPYQQRLWDKVPNPDYVTPPAKGSMHSRGAAVDLTIVDAEGKELDMGTPYDFFGKAAHTDHTNLPKKVLENRRLLRETLEKVGFKGIRTEWWHFSYQSKTWPLSDYVWPCE